MSTTEILKVVTDVSATDVDVPAAAAAVDLQAVLDVPGDVDVFASEHPDDVAAGDDADDGRAVDDRHRPDPGVHHACDITGTGQRPRMHSVPDNLPGV